MLTTQLRQIGGSTMMRVPPVFLEQMQLQSGAVVGLSIKNGRLMMEPKPRPQYTMAELLAKSDFSEAEHFNDRALIDAPAVGGELI